MKWLFSQLTHWLRKTKQLLQESNSVEEGFIFKGNLNKASYTATWERSLLVETTSLRKGTTKGKKAPSNTRATVLYLQEKSISNLENYKPKYCLHINITEKIASKECYVHLQTICIYIYIHTVNVLNLFQKSRLVHCGSIGRIALTLARSQDQCSANFSCGPLMKLQPSPWRMDGEFVAESCENSQRKFRKKPENWTMGTWELNHAFLKHLGLFPCVLQLSGSMWKVSKTP